MDHKLSQSHVTAVILTIIITLLLMSVGVGIWRILNSSSAPLSVPEGSLPEKAVSTNSTPVNSTPTESIATNSSPTNTTQPTPTVTASSCPDSGACNDDAQTYCADEWSGTAVEASWKLDFVRCLYDEHGSEISAACRESLECRQKLNEDLLSACKNDKREFCNSVRPSPGSEPLVDCLEALLAELSADCAAAWTRHDAAKPR